MVTILRILFLVLVLSTFLINLGWRRRIVVIAILSLLMVIATIVTIELTNRPEQEKITPQIPAVFVSPAPTREPEGPSFKAACRQFQLVVSDIGSGDLPLYADRKKRFDEIRASATFPGSPTSFVGLIDFYADAVDRKLGMDGTAVPPTISETDVEALDRTIRRARDNMLSECRARQG